MGDVEMQETIPDMLNDLVVNNQNAWETYETAADAVENKYFKQIFVDYAQQRRRFATELNQLINRDEDQIDEEFPSETGTLSGALQRAWINMNAAFGRGDEVILTECLRLEKNSLQTYSDIQNQDDLPDGAQSMIQHHVSLIRTEFEHLQTLKDALSDI